MKSYNTFSKIENFKKLIDNKEYSNAAYIYIDWYQTLSTEESKQMKEYVDSKGDDVKDEFNRAINSSLGVFA